MRFRLLVWSLLLTQCGGQGPETGTRPPRALAPTSEARQNPGLPAFVVADVPSGTQGPVVAAHGDAALAVWAAQSESGWRFQSAAIQTQVGTASPAVDLGAAPDNLELLLLRALSNSDSILAYTHLDKNGGHQLTALLLDAQGRALSQPAVLGASGEALLWLDVVPTSKGPLVFWASSRGDRADIRAAALDSKGIVRAAAHEVASDLRAWQVSGGSSGAALATVRAVANKPNGRVTLQLLDESGMETQPVIAVTQDDTAELDLDVAAVGENFVLAWTDRQSGDARLCAAAVSAAGKITTPPHPLTPPLGDQSLVKLAVAPNASVGYVLWEDLLSPDLVRKIQIAPIDAKSQLGQERASIRYGATLERTPEVAVDAYGLSLVSPVATSVLEEASAPAKLGVDFDGVKPATVPTLINLTNQLQIRGVEPLLMAAKPSVPSLVWGLHCGEKACFALGVMSSESRAVVLGVSVAKDGRAGRSLMSSASVAKPVSGIDSFDAKLRAYLGRSPEATARPRLTAVRVIADLEPLADLAVTPGEVPLIATLTYFDPEAPLGPLSTPAADGKREPLQARIDIRGPLGEATSDKSFVSLRARSAGGLDWAVSADGKNKLLAWSALDQKQPHVFVTAYDSQGKKQSQRMLTHAKANVADVTAAPAATGYFVGWIDDEGPKSQGYLVQLSPKLERKGAERAISTKVSGKTGLNFLATGNELWAVWSDTEDTSRNRADLFIRRFAATDGHPLGTEQRLFETPEHSHSPILAASESDVVVAWMENEPRDDSPEGTATVRLAKLNHEGRPGSIRSVQSPSGQVTAFGFDCAKTMCHVVVCVDLGGVGQIEAALVDPRATTPIQTKPLIGSLGPADESVFPVIAGTDAYWVDHSTSKRVRVMRAAIEW